MRRIRFNRHTIFSAVLNVTGLTLALSVFMILMVQVMYDWRYDRCYPGHDNIYRLEYLEYTAQEDLSSYSANWSRPMITMVKTVLPQAEAIGTYVYNKGNIAPMRETGSDKSGIDIKFADCDYDLLKVFPFEFTEGDTSLFSSPGMALISEEGAARIFGKESPVGKEVEFSSSTLVRYFPKRFTIAGVYRDFPENSSMDREILVNLGNISMNNTGEWAYYCYIKTSDHYGLQSVLDSLACKMSNGNEKADFRLTPLHEAYYNQNVSPDNIAKGSRPITITLFSVALLVLIIAAINFINFSMASVPFRIKGLNTRRVVGATRSCLIWTQLGSTFSLVLTAFILSAVVMSIVAATGLASYISCPLRVQDNPAVLLIGLGAAAVTALVAGILPARYSTSFNPAMVLKGSFSLSSRGRNLRSALIGIQYLISFVLIICALFITLQVKYMKGFDMGYDREHIIEFNISNNYSFSRESLREMLLRNPAITDVTFSAYSIASETKMPWGRSFNGKPVYVECLPVDRNFISFFGLKLTGGRDFLPSDDSNPDGAMIVNRTFLEMYPFYHIGSAFSGHTDKSIIIGSIQDFNFKPLQHSIGPFCLYSFGSTPWWQLSTGYAKIIPGDIPSTFEFIRKAINELDSSINPEDIDVRFLDATIESLYAKEDRLGRIITTASWISLLISVIGILGLVYFETQFRRKEIALRRVHGASVKEILVMINRYYLSITVTCFIVTAPISIVIIRRWVSSFPYRSPIPVWIFLAALLLILLLTSIAVTVLSHRAALRNPIDSISTE